MSKSNEKPIKFIRLKEVMVRTGMKRSSLYKLIQDGLFPPPVKLGGPDARAAGWVDSEVTNWQVERVGEKKSVGCKFVRVVPMTFKPNRRFKRDYDRIYRQNPEVANVFLLLAELADSNGQVVTDEQELADLFAVRFDDPKEYSL